MDGQHFNQSVNRVKSADYDPGELSYGPDELYAAYLDDQRPPSEIRFFVGLGIGVLVSLVLYALVAIIVHLVL